MAAAYCEVNYLGAITTSILIITILKESFVKQKKELMRSMLF